MKEMEQEISTALANRLLRKIHLTNKEYLWFDAYDGNKNFYEYKDRGKHYDDALIEFNKFATNIMFARQMGYRFLYVMRMEGKTYIFNISDLESREYNFKWEWRTMPKKTEFADTDPIEKYVGYVNIKDASLVF